MKLQLFLNGNKVIDREIALTPGEINFIKTLRLEDRVKYMEEIVQGHSMDLKGKYWQVISKAKNWEIYFVIEKK